MTDDWSHPEIVRGLQGLTSAVQELTKRFDALDGRFVPREVFELRQKQIDAWLAEHGKEITDLAADQERHRREHSEQSQSSWRFWVSVFVAPVVVGVLVAILAIKIGA